MDDTLDNINGANRKQLIDYLNHLISNDFGKLVFLLYRADISEAKLKHLLSENNNQDAATVIANLLTEREREKELSRQQYRQNNQINEDERW